jgi:hypothetical protein
LYIHFAFGTQGETIHVFMYTDVREDRLDNDQPSRIDFLALLAVDLGFHQIDQVRLAGINLEEKGESFTKFLSKIPKNLTDEPSSQHRSKN